MLRVCTLLYGDVAQLGERLLCKQGVAGSSPVISTKQAGGAKMKDSSKIYTHDEAMLIIELFEDVLSGYNIKVPSPEDDERDPDDDIGLYGSTYSDLLDSVEDHLVGLLARYNSTTEIIQDEFSGTV